MPSPPLRLGGGAGVGPVRTLWVGRSEAALGAQRPVAPPARRGSPFLPRNGEKEGRGQAPWTPSFMAARSHSLVLGSLSLVGSRGYFLRYAKTDLGRIFEGKCAEKAFLRKKGSKSGHVDGCHNRPTTATPKAFPSGGRWAGPPGWFWWRVPSEALGRGCRRQVVRLGPAQVSPCEVVSRPVPGGGSRLSLEKARTQRVAGGCPPAPLFYGPLVPTRSFWRCWRIVPVEGLLRYPSTCPDLGRFFG